MIVTSLVLICILFGIYGCLSGIEAGIAIVRLDKQKTSNRRATNLFTPIWEVTNVFLVFGFTALAVLFGNGLVAISKAVFSTLIIGLVSLIIRSTLVLLIFYQKVPQGKNWKNITFCIVSFLIPLSFGAAGIVLITGQPFWRSSLGMGLFTTLTTGLLALAVSFAALFDMKRFETTSLYANLIFMLAMLSTIFISTKFVVFTPSYNSLARNLSILLFFAGIGQLIVFLSKRWQKMWLILSLVALAAPVFLGLANRPYVMYPGVLLNDAYSASAYGGIAVAGLLFTLPIMIIGLLLLVFLLLQHPTNHGSKLSARIK